MTELALHTRRNFLGTVGLVSLGLLTGCATQQDRPLVKEKPRPGSAAAQAQNSDPASKPNRAPAAELNEKPVAVATKVPSGGVSIAPTPASVINRPAEATRLPEKKEPADSKAPTLEENLKAMENVTNPLLRAAGMLIVLRMNNQDHWKGHVNLFLNDQNEPCMITAWHVIKGYEKAAYDFIVPGLGRLSCPEVTWLGIPNRRNDPGTDTPVTYNFENNDRVAHTIKEHILNNRLTLLQEVTNMDIPIIRAATIMSDKNQLAELKFHMYNKKTNLFEFTVERGQICRGFSGQAALIVENGILTNKSCGIIVGASVTEEVHCSNYAVAVRPHN